MRYQTFSPQPLPDSPKAPNQEVDEQGEQSLLPAQIRFDADFYLQSWIHPAALGECSGSVLYGMESLRLSLFQQHRFSLNRPHFKASLITESHSDTCNVKRGTGAKTPGTFALTFPTLEVCTHLFGEQQPRWLNWTQVGFCPCCPGTKSVLGVQITL